MERIVQKNTHSARTGIGEAGRTARVDAFQDADEPPQAPLGLIGSGHFVQDLMKPSKVASDKVHSCPALFRPVARSVLSSTHGSGA